MPWNTDSLLRTCGHPANRAVLAYLQRAHPSAHSDISSELTMAAAQLLGVRRFCLDTQGYAYEALHLPNGLIFALAFGMSMLVFRLPESLLPPEAKGATRTFGEISGDWLALEMFRGGDAAGDRALARRLCAAAYQAAGSIR